MRIYRGSQCDHEIFAEVHGWGGGRVSGGRSGEVVCSAQILWKSASVFATKNAGKSIREFLPRMQDS
jgi:hypothetical protein